jgi:uncharacterized membrane protein
MSDPVISTDPNQSGNANLIYILYLVSCVVGVTAIIGVVMAYMAKDDAPDWLRSHYHNQINIFWKGLLYMVIGAVLSIVLIGFLILLVAFIWYIIRIVKGMQSLAKGEPYPDPASWTF